MREDYVGASIELCLDGGAIAKPLRDQARHLTNRHALNVARRQRPQEGLAIRFGMNPSVQHNHGATVRLAPDQASEALLETQYCLRQGILAERVVEQLRTRLEDRIAWNGERQPCHYKERERFADHIDAFPEARRAKHDGARMLLQGLDQLSR